MFATIVNKRKRRNARQSRSYWTPNRDEGDTRENLGTKRFKAHGSSRLQITGTIETLREKIDHITATRFVQIIFSNKKDVFFF